MVRTWFFNKLLERAASVLALLDGGVKFFQLDETGNFQVMAQAISGTTDTTVTKRGSVDWAKLNVSET